MKKVLLYGWYSADNLGDDFMLETTYQFLKKNDVEVKILQKKDDKNYFIDYQNDYEKIEYFLYKDYSKNKIINKLIKLTKLTRFAIHSKYFKSFDSIIFIGGGYVNGVFNFMELINMYLLSKKFKNVYFTGQTVGPFKNKIESKIAKKIYSKGKRIFVREIFSDKILNEYNIKHEIVADDAFLFDEKNKKYEIYSNNSKEKNYILINLKDFSGYEQAQNKFFTIIKNLATKLNYDIKCIPFRSNKDSKEYKNHIELVKYLKENNINASICIPKNIAELKKLYDESSFVIGTAYHSVTLALLFNKIPYSAYIGEYYKMKIQGILSFYNLEKSNCFDILNENEEVICNKIIKDKKDNTNIANITKQLCNKINAKWFSMIGE